MPHCQGRAHSQGSNDHDGGGVRTSSASHRGSGKAGGQRRATIHDVARMAGVSRQAVSNVIRGQGRVGQTTNARVRQVIETLDYAPHSGAMSLRLQRTQQVAHPMPAVELGLGNAIAAKVVQALAVCVRRAALPPAAYRVG